jgi:hypothetical protein
MNIKITILFLFLSFLSYGQITLTKGDSTWLYQFEESEGYSNKYVIYFIGEYPNNHRAYTFFYAKDGNWEIVGKLEFNHNAYHQNTNNVLYFKNGYRVAVDINFSLDNDKGVMSIDKSPVEIKFDTTHWKVDNPK